AAARIVESSVRAERRDLDRQQDLASPARDGKAGVVSEHCAVLAGIHARERVTLVELRAPVDDLPGFTGWAGAARVPLGDRVEDAPLPQSLERIVVRERTLDPERRSARGIAAVEHL